MKSLALMTLLGVVLGFSALAHAALVDNGNGLIFDTDLNITWYDAPPVPRSWDEATAWAAGLTLGGTVKGSWRLPAQGTTSNGGTFVSGGEMWHLYYDELHNLAGGELAHTVPFKNLWPDRLGYWTGMELASDNRFVWCFWFNGGHTDVNGKDSLKLALAVHSGNVGAPVTAKVNVPPMSDAFKMASPTKKTTSVFTNNYQFVAKWGTSGTGNGQFQGPAGVAVDSSGNVYVADTINNRIQKFTSTGAFITAWGSPGKGNGQFEYPSGVAVDAPGNVYVADTINSRIQKFTPTGAFITAWTSGKHNGQFDFTDAVAVDASGNVYASDRLNCSVQKFTATGTFITTRGGCGTGIGAFNYPIGIAVDASGIVYVADMNNHRIDRFPSDFTFVMTPWGSNGAGNGQFAYPSGVAVDASGNVYVADRDNDRIQKLSSTGAFITAWGSSGTGNGQFKSPSRVAVDASGNVYVADRGNDRIQKFGPAPVSVKVNAPPTPDQPNIVAPTKIMGSMITSNTAPSGATATPVPTTPDLAGQWKSSIGLVYDITQKRDHFGWTVSKTNEKGEGILKGTTLSASWQGPQGSGSSQGQVTAIDATGRATQIDWKNGVRFYRSEVKDTPTKQEVTPIQLPKAR
jgi:DNA-binding beta-propeller fold protein YncE